MQDTVQTLEDMRRSYEGYTVPCPICANNPDMQYTPRVLIGNGECLVCRSEYSVTIDWEANNE